MLLHSELTEISAAPIDSAQDARNVREDTAELASYALSDQASVRSSSPPRTRSGPASQYDSYFDTPADGDTSTPRNIDFVRQDPIPEVSEPVTPASGMSTRSLLGTSALTKMLQHSPPEDEANSEEESESDPEDQPLEPENGTPKPTPQVNFSADENTPLIAKYPKPSHPDWIRGEPDIESQSLRHRPSWPKLRKVIAKPVNKTVSVARVVVNPKSWNRRAIWEKGVKEPVQFIPPVILGVLLNVLDALSYGMY